MEEELKILGLTEQERIVYTRCLKLGSAKASVIAAETGIERQASYYTLKLLVKKGLITTTIKSGVMYYSCVDPILLQEKLQEETLQKQQAIRTISKEYEEMEGIAISHPKVEQYEGIEGFKTLIRELVNGPDTEVYSYIPEKIITFREAFLKLYTKNRIKRKIKVKVLTEKTPVLMQYAQQNKDALREMRFIEKTLQNKDYCLAIGNNKVIFIRLTEKEQIGIKIEDEKFAELQKNLFYTVWENAEK